MEHVGQTTKMVGKVEFFNTPIGQLPNRAVDKPVGVHEFTIPMNKKFNQIQTALKEAIASFLGTSRLSYGSGSAVSSGDLVIGAIYYVESGTAVFTQTAYGEESHFVATEETYTGTCTIKLVYDPKTIADNLFMSDGSIGAGDEGKNGIAYEDTGVLMKKFITSINAISGASCEWLGYYDTGAASETFSQDLVLGHGYQHSANAFETNYAKVSVSEVIDANRRFSVYWKINIG